MISSNFKLTGLHCESCVKIITKKLLGILGVKEANVTLAGDASVTSDREITKQEVVIALTGLEYKVL